MNDFRKIFYQLLKKKEKILDASRSSEFSEFSIFGGVFPFNSALYLDSYCNKVFVK